MSRQIPFSEYSEDPDIFYEWTYKGQTYLRNCLNEVMMYVENKFACRMVGTYYPATDTIEDRPLGSTSNPKKRKMCSE